MKDSSESWEPKTGEILNEIIVVQDQQQLVENVMIDSSRGLLGLLYSDGSYKGGLKAGLHKVSNLNPKKWRSPGAESMKIVLIKHALGDVSVSLEGFKVSRDVYDFSLLMRLKLAEDSFADAQKVAELVLSSTKERQQSISIAQLEESLDLQARMRKALRSALSAIDDASLVYQNNRENFLIKLEGSVTEQLNAICLHQGVSLNCWIEDAALQGVDSLIEKEKNSQERDVHAQNEIEKIAHETKIKAAQQEAEYQLVKQTEEHRITIEAMSDDSQMKKIHKLIELKKAKGEVKLDQMARKASILSNKDITTNLITIGRPDLAVEAYVKGGELDNRGEIKFVDAESIAPSVGLVLVSYNRGGEQKLKEMGTAWIYTQSLCVTCGHVIERIEKLEHTSKVKVTILFEIRKGISDQLSKRYVPVSGWEKHDRYKKESGNYMTNDFAILEIDEEASYNMGKLVLDVASTEEIRALKKSDGISYLGYPSWEKGNEVSSIDKSSTWDKGVINNLTGWNDEMLDAEYAYVIHTNMTLTHGASGSPVFNESNKVIGIVCSKKLQGEEDCPSGLKHVQRIDLLEEWMHRRIS